MIKYIIIKWVEHVARMEEVRGAFKIIICKPTGKSIVGRSRCRWENNIHEIQDNTRN